MRWSGPECFFCPSLHSIPIPHSTSLPQPIRAWADTEVRTRMKVSERISALFFLSVEISKEEVGSWAREINLGVWRSETMGLVEVTQILRDNKSHYEAGWEERDFKLGPLIRRDNELHRAQKGTMPAPREPSLMGTTRQGRNHKEHPFQLQRYYRSFFLSTRRSLECGRREKHSRVKLQKLEHVTWEFLCKLSITELLLVDKIKIFFLVSNFHFN